MTDALPTLETTDLDSTTPPPPASIWRRLRKTPMRDLLRLRLTGRLDLDTKLADAELSADARALIGQTVKTTRLWKLEKAAVADELIAHFRDGQTAGSEQRQLIEDFGDPQATAKLIRRAKKRSRSLAAKTYVWARRCALALLAFYLFTALRFYTGSPTVKVDYLAQLNADAAAVAPEDQAWPIYRETWTQMNQNGAWDTLDAMAEIDGPWDSLTPQSGAAWEPMADWLDLHQPSLDVARRGGLLPGLGILATHMHNTDPRDVPALYYSPNSHQPEDPSAWSDAERLVEESVVHVLLPHLGQMRRWARVLTTDTRYALDQNQPQRAVDNLRAIIGHARQSTEQATLINGLVGVSIYELACNSLNDALQHNPDSFDSQQLRTLAHAFASFSPRTYIRPTSEWYYIEDLIQRIYTDDGRGNGRLTADGFEVLKTVIGYSYNDRPFGLWGVLGDAPEKHLRLAMLGATVKPALGALIADRQATTRRLGELMQLAEMETNKTMWQGSASLLEDELESWSNLERSRHVILFRLLPAAGAATRTAERAEARRDGALLGIALELYRREHGDWPGQLADLTPTYLPALPIDRITGGLLRYKIVDGSPWVYSLGGDREDDSGQPYVDPETGEAQNYRAAYWQESQDPDRQGDWIIYPEPQ